MNQATPEPGAIHSAAVEMLLFVGDQQHSVGQMAADFILLEAPLAEAIPPGLARLSLTIDGYTDEWPIRLPDAIPAGVQEVKISSI